MGQCRARLRRGRSTATRSAGRPSTARPRDRRRLRPRPRDRARVRGRRRGRRPRLRRPRRARRRGRRAARWSSGTPTPRTPPTSSSRCSRPRIARVRTRSSWSAGTAAGSTTSSPTRCSWHRPSSRDLQVRGARSATREVVRRARRPRAPRPRSATCARCCPSAGRPPACAPKGCGSRCAARRSARIDPRREQRVPRPDRARLARRRRAARDRRSTHETDEPVKRPVTLAARSLAVLSAAVVDVAPASPPAPRRPRRSRSSPTTRSRCRSRCSPRFTKQTGIKVKILQAGDAGPGAEPGDPHQGRTRSATCSSASTTRSSPARSTRAIFEPYAPPALGAGARRSTSSTPTAPAHADRPRRRVHQLRQEVVRQAEASRCRRRSTTSPSPRTRALLVVENPATSSPGLAFLLATIAEYGDDGWRDYWDEAARRTT